MKNEHTPMVDWAARSTPAKVDDEQHYESRGFKGDFEAEVKALELLKHLDGLAVSQARLVLRRAEFMLDATTTLDCSSTWFRQADEGLRRALEKSL